MRVRALLRRLYIPHFYDRLENLSKSICIDTSLMWMVANIAVITPFTTPKLIV